MLQRVHQAFKQFVKPIGAPSAGSSLKQEKEQNPKMDGSPLTPPPVEESLEHQNPAPSQTPLIASQDEKQPGDQELPAEALKDSNPEESADKNERRWSASLWLELLNQVVRSRKMDVKAPANQVYLQNKKRTSKGLKFQRGIIIDKKAA